MSHIWVPKVGIIEGELPFHGGRFQGEYTLTRRKADTEEIVQVVGPFHNLITDYGLDTVGTVAFKEYVYVGTGTTPPAVSNTKMAAFLASVASPAPGGAWQGSLLRGGSPDHWVQGSGTYRFPAGAAAGNITEVGIGRGNTLANHMVCSRALVVDGGGSPISITVLADEYLDVTYSLRYYPYTGADVVQTLNLSGTNYTITTRALGVTTASMSATSDTGYMAWLGFQEFSTGTAIGTPPSLAPITSTDLVNKGTVGSIVCTANPYVSGSYTATGVIRAGLTEANLTYGIRGMVSRPGVTTPAGRFFTGVFQSTISPAILKDSTKVLQFGASISWSRYP